MQQSLMRINSNDLVESLQDVLTIGEIVAKSQLFPDIQTQAKAVMIILAGRELGIPPMAALRGMHVIKGKAEIGAGLFAAMIKASGKYDFRVAKSTDTECALLWFENGKPVGNSSFTIEEARRAKLVKPDSNWEKFPRHMCFARALTLGQKQFAPDVGIGAVYAPGEVESADGIDDYELLPPEVIALPDELPTGWPYDQLGELLAKSEAGDSSGTRRYCAAMLGNRAYQALANYLGRDTDSIIAQFGQSPELSSTKDQIAEAREKHQPAQAKLKYDQKHRAHDKQHAARFDAVITRLTAYGVKGVDLLREVNSVVHGEMENREVETRYELTNEEVDAVCDVFEKWAESLEKDSRAKKVEV